MTKEELSLYWSKRIRDVDNWLEQNKDKYYINAETGNIVFYNKSEVPLFVLEDIEEQNNLSNDELDEMCETINMMFDD